MTTMPTCGALNDDLSVRIRKVIGSGITALELTFMLGLFIGLVGGCVYVCPGDTILRNNELEYIIDSTIISWRVRCYLGLLLEVTTRRPRFRWMPFVLFLYVWCWLEKL